MLMLELNDKRKLSMQRFLNQGREILDAMAWKLCLRQRKCWKERRSEIKQVDDNATFQNYSFKMLQGNKWRWFANWASSWPSWLTDKTRSISLISCCTCSETAIWIRGPVGVTGRGCGRETKYLLWVCNCEF